MIGGPACVLADISTHLFDAIHMDFRRSVKGSLASGPFATGLKPPVLPPLRLFLGSVRAQALPFRSDPTN